MARLRKPVTPDSEDSDECPKSILPRTKAPSLSQINLDTETSPTKRSTRKAAAQKRNVEYAEDDNEDDVLVPKAQAVDTPVRKQRTLKPVASNTKLLQRLSAVEVSSAEKPARRKREEQLGYNKQLAKTAARKQTKPKKEIVEPLHIEEEHDESLWCGSDSDEADEEDPVVNVKDRRRPLNRETELPSAQSDKGLSSKECAIKEESNIITQSAKEVIDLTSSSPISSPIAKPPKPLSRPFPAPSSLDRPCSSSDNDAGALLHFSPPAARFRSPRKAPPTTRPSTPPPAPSSPTKLTSPSKRKPRIPTPPALRPSLDAFWSAEVINTWNDTYSPAKPLFSPKKNKSPSKRIDFDSSSDAEFPSPSGSPRKSPSKKCTSSSPSVAQLHAQRKEFQSQKHSLAETFLTELDQTITSGKITTMSAPTGGIKLLWSRTLKTTAGRANWRREAIRLRSPTDPNDIQATYRHHCSIELAEKVIDDEERLMNVLAHEYCHLTTFMISEVRNQPHGKEFKSWATKASRAFGDRGVEVTTKHSYAISYKYIWECEGCGYEFKRHSKSVDTARHSCGRCKGKLVQVKPMPREGGKEKSEYQVFVKGNFSRVKRGLEERGLESAMGKVMEALGREYREMKEKEKMKNLAVVNKLMAEVAEVEIALEALNIVDVDV